MIHFGTGGWRAIIGDEFTKVNVQLLSMAMAEKLKADGQDSIVIGCDRRFLSKEATMWVAETMAGAGIISLVIDREAPTPLIMYTVKYYALQYGLAVTASHNPAIYNGIKVFVKGGRDADEVFTSELEALAAALEGKTPATVPYEEGLRRGIIREINPMNEYIDSIIRSVNMDAIRSRSLKIVLDPMYGVSKTALQTIFITARCDVDIIHERRDALFGGRLPAPNVKTLISLMSFVEENHCDIGIATDGDADRLGVVDDKGNFLHPNEILVLLYYYLLKYKGWRGPVVRNIATTHLLDGIAAAYGEQCYEVPVGFKHVSSKMEETGAIIGGESSGGLTVRGHIQGKDGIYAGALLVEMIATTGRKLSEIYSEITDEFGTFEMEERDYKFTQERKDEIMNTLMVEKRLPEFGAEIERISYEDGCKVYFKNGGWIISRFSGTEPLLRVFCEMADIKSAAAMTDKLTEFLKLS